MNRLKTYFLLLFVVLSLAFTWPWEVAKEEQEKTLWEMLGIKET